MTRKELEAISNRKFGEDIGSFDSLIILPMKKLHESGYRTMSYIAVKNNKPLCRLSGNSDVLHINGVLGVGTLRDKLPELISPETWMIDCLKKSGLLRLFCRKPLTVGADLSSFEVFTDGTHD